MLHTSGFPRAPFNALDWDDRERRLARFSEWRCNWEPGTRYEYHPTSAHWVLAEIIERCTSADFRVFIRERILDPLGLVGLQIGVPAEQQGDINDLVLTGEHATPDELEAAIGVRSLPLTEVTPDALMSFNRPEVRAVGVPGGGGVTTAADLALYYQALLSDPAGIWKPEVLADVTANVRNRLPDYLGVPANRSLGLLIAGDDGKASHTRPGPHGFAAGVRAQRRGRSDRVGRSGDRAVVLLPHEWARPARDSASRGVRPALPAGPPTASRRSAGRSARLALMELRSRPACPI